MTGTAGQKRLPTEYFATRPFPLPPVAKQKRIVAKVDELMALCDKLEAQQQERERRFPMLSRACHVRFVESPTPANLKAIFDEAESVSPDDLRKTILKLAVRGELVPQVPDDVSATATLAAVLEERNRVSRSRKLKTPQPPSTELGEFERLPRNWGIASPDQLTAFQKNALTIGPFGSSLLKSEYKNAGIPLVFVRDIRSENFGGPETRFITDSKATELSSHTVRPGDLLVTKMGDPPGDTSIYPDSCPPGIITADCIKLTPHSDLACVSFLRYALRAPQLAEQFISITRGVAHKKVSLGRFRSLVVPLPPITEQKRIVAKVDQLMALVDQLEEQQRQKGEIAQAFAQAAVTAITGTEIKEPEKMKAPKTELISRLQINSKPKATNQSPLADLLSKHKGELTAKTLWQQSGLEIDAFYQQLKTEMANGWIVEPEKAVMKEVEAN